MKTFQIITNSSCNLRCTYCYEHLDAKKNSFENIKPYLDTVVANGASKDNPTLMIDLIGGEPFFVPDLLEEIMDYCVNRYKQWGYCCLVFATSTNGTLLRRDKQRSIIKKYGAYLHLGISIDGDKEKHDKHRLTVGGEGSFNDVSRGMEVAIGLLKRNQLTIKATFTKDSIQDYARSIKYLYRAYGNHVESIQGNFNFEEKFDAYDGALIANETLEIVRFLRSQDYSAEFLFKMNKDGDKKSIGLSNPFVKSKPTPLVQNKCGSCNQMLSLGYDGQLFGCNRFSTMKKDGMALGEIKDGEYINLNNPIADKVKHAYKEVPDSCQTCRFNVSCSDCVAIPIDEGISHEEFYKQRRMCGYTKASELAKLYNQLLSIHQRQRG